MVGTLGVFTIRGLETWIFHTVFGWWMDHHRMTMWNVIFLTILFWSHFSILGVFFFISLPVDVTALDIPTVKTPRLS